MGRNLVTQDIQDFQSRLELLPIRSPRLPRPSHDLGYRLVMSRGNVSLSDFVSTSLYLLSNHLHDPEDGDKGLQLLCLLFEHDVQLLTEILLSEPTTGRATWESLINYAEKRHHSRSLEFMLDVGIRCGWINPCDTRVLVSALQMEYPTDIVAGIIDHLYRSGRRQRGRDILDAILMALRKGRLSIARSLVQRFDINAQLPSEALELDRRLGKPLSIFLAFIAGFNHNEGSPWDELDFFLSNGADVDKLMPSSWYTSYGLPSSRWYNKNEINRALRPTILDHSFYLQRSLFERLAEHSKVPNSALTRSGLEISLEKGADALWDYLQTRQPEMDLLNFNNVRSILNFVMKIIWKKYTGEQACEDRLQCSLDVHGTRYKVLQSITQYTVDLARDPGLFFNIHSLSMEILRKLCSRSREDGFQILDILLNRGLDITDDHLTKAVRRNGTGILKWLQPRVKNFSAKAAGALATAARLDNFEAVEFLLQNGANPDAFIDRPHIPRGFLVKKMAGTFLNKAYSVQATVAGGSLPSNSGQSSLRMIQFLVERGAKLVVGSNDSTPFEFIAVLLKDCREDVELFEKVKFVLGTLKQSKHRANPPAYLLELCAQYQPVQRNKAFDEFKERMKIFEYLLDEGADVSPGSPLAALVRVGGPKELVERVLRLGADLNAFTAVSYQYSFGDTQTPLQAAASKANEDLVYLFLRQGANVNSRARGRCGKTALQAIICEWNPATEQEHRRKMTICDLLLSSGADVNAAPARRVGITALQGAVAAGDLELVAILVRDGARVNAPPAIFGRHSYSALDFAAYSGRLDIAKLLLDGNALSENRGTTGYDGAIKHAEKAGHHAVASLIRGYHRNGMEPSLYSLDAEEAAEDYHIHENTADDETTDTYEISTDDDTSSGDEESSSSESGAGEDGSSSRAESLMRRDASDPEDTQAFPGLPVVGDSLMDDFVSSSRIGVDLTEDGVQRGWENEPMPDACVGSLAGRWDSPAFPDLQVVTNASMEGQVNHSGMGFVLPEEEMQTQWGDESILQSSWEPWAGMPDDGALWQRVFEEQDLEFGFATFDADPQMSAAYFEELETDGRDTEMRED